MITRIFSALVMGIVVVYSIFNSPNQAFNLAVLIVMLGGLWEWHRLCGTSIVYLLSSVLGLVALFVAYDSGVLDQSLRFILLACAVLLWLFKTLKLADKSNQSSAFCMLDGLASLSLAWLAVVVLRDEFGAHSLMLALLMVWSADTFAYFGGKQFGKTKLAPTISPNKSREGVISGVIMAMLVAVCYSHFLITPLTSFAQMLVLLIVTILVALISVVGDLSESKLKRAAGVKDSGKLIPGHGGILDRIDGLIAGLVIYAFYALLMRSLT